MSLTFVQDISPATSTLRDGVTDVSADEIYLVESSAPSARVFGLTTGTQRGSNVTVNAGCSGITLLTTASALVVSGTSTNYDLIEKTSLYRQSYSSGNTTAAVTKGQQIAGNTSSSTAFASSSTAGNLVKFTNTFPTPVSITTPTYLAGYTVTTVIVKGSNWLLGTDKNKVFEIDSSGNLIDTTNIFTLNSANFATEEYSSICGLSYANDTLAFTTAHGRIGVINYSTKTLLWESTTGDSTTASTPFRGTVLCDAASGMCVFSCNQTVLNNNVLIEFDFTRNPPEYREIAFLDSNGLVVASGINTTNNKCWVLQQSNNKIRVFTVVPRTTTSLASDIQDPISTFKEGRIIRIIDNGVGTASVELDTGIPAASTSFLSSSGKTIIELATYESGTNQKFGINERTS